MEEMLLRAPVELISPNYSIYDFYGGLYKIVRFNYTSRCSCGFNKEGHTSYDQKLDASLSRSRRAVLEYALCNKWKYFCTFTIAKNNFDRSDLKTWHKKFTQWLRDQRKKYIKKGLDLDFNFLLVPEPHKDGSWHMHGLFSDITPLLVNFCDIAAAGISVPVKLLTGEFFNWSDYQNKFGFCSFGVIRDHIAVSYYITKYISKSLSESCIDVGLHTYYVSRGLNRPVKHGDIYGGCSSLDKYLTNYYDFCATGMVSVSGPAAWTFGLEYMDYDLIQAFSNSDVDSDPEVDFYFSCIQEVIEGF